MGKRKQLNVRDRRSLDYAHAGVSHPPEQEANANPSQLIPTTLSNVHNSTTCNDPSNNSNSDSDSDRNDEVGRGHTLMADIWNQDLEKVIIVKFNERNQPIGPECSSLASFVGVVGRNTSLAPQGYSDWRLVPVEYKKKCMAEIKKRYDIPKRGETYVLGQLGRVVKDFRGELKPIYEKYKHRREKLIKDKRDPRIPEDQWLKLISYWDQEKTKKRATINRNNQKSQTMPHCVGRKSFACVSAEEKSKIGIEPTRGELFILTHKDRKDGKPIDEGSDQAVKTIQQMLGELPNGKEQSQGKVAWEGDIYSQVIKQKESLGKVRGVGRGVCPTSLWGPVASSNVESANLEDHDKVKNLEDALNEMKESNDEQLRTIEQNHSEQMRIMQANHKAEMEKVKEDQTRQLKKVKLDQARLEAHVDKLTTYLVSQNSGYAS